MRLKKSSPLRGIILLILVLAATGGCTSVLNGESTPTSESISNALLPMELSPSAIVIESTPTSINVSSALAPTVSVTQGTSSPTLTAVTSGMVTSSPDYPDSFYIHNISGHKQVYSLGCEASAAFDWANYFGVSFYEFDFQVSLPLSDNPDYGYVGDVNSVWGQIPPYAYGVHSGPVADQLVEFGLPARSVRNYTLDEVKQKLSESKPIIVWVIGNMEYSEPVEYIDKQGRSVMVAPYEHVVILTGYNETSIRYMTNGKFYDIPTEVFLSSWSVLGNMAVIHD